MKTTFKISQLRHLTRNHVQGLTFKGQLLTESLN